MYDDESSAEYTNTPMAALTISPDYVDDNKSGRFKCTIVRYDQRLEGHGTCSAIASDKYSVRFEAKAEDESDEVRYYYSGELDMTTLSVKGSCGQAETVEDHYEIFVLKRTPSHILRFRPSPFQLTAYRYPALWKYAISAVVAGVRRDRFSWTYFRERRDNRRRYLELTENYRHGDEFPRCRQLLTWQEARFYQDLLKFGPSRLQEQAPEFNHW